MIEKFSVLRLGLLSLFAAASLRAEGVNIGALGRLEPAGGLLELAGFGDLVSRVPVKADQTVKRGDVLVEFAGGNGAESDLKLARLALREAEAAGPRTLAARERGLNLAERAEAMARDRLARYEQLSESSIAPQELAERRQGATAAAASLAAARDDLAQTKLAIELGLERARLQLALAEERLTRSALRAPADGTVLEIRAHPGEAGSGALVRFADLSRMVVVAEVFEVDLPRVRPGARCEVEHRVFGAKLPGRVEAIGRIVNAQTKTAAVRIALDAPEPAAHFLGLEVTVSIIP